ncbi:phosphonate ABC transporter ATP-binding protein [Rhodopseudomonas palustris]|uniref:Phosphonate ABC transporter ATP-binding protein n=1 Tax=Rhodopseudomonas palustris (strain ATCC BAA-98 / CGA009) TaxID=258594 RepID=A0AAE9Y0C7_RHOPA|nr:phosphonate ABC transporter ATP-binding protein [Rhodopseudomonas palustris]QQM02883.1 Aliphatic sulfonates import ATP-binding protein SsuB [Rhodopseudomonas palustris]WAB79057.1 phosphonate ABC transporter ATP-binding protein [Rhodopseudomonas palustris]WBU31205.1 phosphonate ABC transporter ATP-binding protein [Rhodopseudomonas palustris]WCL91521.1 phosphonate ABC transporter ATP-binding protein [Rhodopseudomonas palustris CGA009]WND52955.1 phosphonate ABC transporter ATP-binding protein 
MKWPVGAEWLPVRKLGMVRGISPDSNLIRIDGISVRRGHRTVLHDVTASFPTAKVTAIVGPSGVGKTTMLGLLNGLIAPASGTVSFSEIGLLTEPTALRAARHQTATIFQDHALIGRLSAIDNVLLGLADTRHPLSPLPWPVAARQRAAKALDDVGLLDLATRRTAQLSGGERQRVGVARALIRRPKLLLGDEPFASVDPALAQQLGGLFRSLAMREGLTVILVLHQLQLARAIADRIIGLSDGRVAFDGPAAAFDADLEARIFPSLALSHDHSPPLSQPKETICSID